MSPEELLADYPPQIQELADGVRAIIEQTVPDIEEKVYRGWRLIGYRVTLPESHRHGGGAYFCYIAPGAESLQLGFEYGILMADPEGLLEGEGKQVRYVTVSSVADFKRDGVRQLIVEAARVAILSKEEKAALRFELDEVRELGRDLQ
ncbi:MAG TPA: DUF1801 domain-containing protein [Anaerolineae bacterium]|jgi:hypothetical protein|nr:DUF1801 domain-containing protein [Anaerolineae bacterium]